jgi:hypothetical protein
VFRNRRVGNQNRATVNHAAHVYQLFSDVACAVGYCDVGQCDAVAVCDTQRHTSGDVANLAVGSAVDLSGSESILAVDDATLFSLRRFPGITKPVNIRPSSFSQAGSLCFHEHDFEPRL